MTLLLPCLQAAEVLYSSPTLSRLGGHSPEWLHIRADLGFEHYQYFSTGKTVLPSPCISNAPPSTRSRDTTSGGARHMPGGVQVNDSSKHEPPQVGFRYCPLPEPPRHLSSARGSIPVSREPERYQYRLSDDGVKVPSTLRC
jgi:hypothetical protein